MSESEFNRKEFDARQYFRNLSEAAKEQAFLMAFSGTQDDINFLVKQVIDFKRMLSFKLDTGSKQK